MRAITLILLAISNLSVLTHASPSLPLSLTNTLYPATLLLSNRGQVESELERVEKNGSLQTPVSLEKNKRAERVGDERGVFFYFWVILPFALTAFLVFQFTGGKPKYDPPVSENHEGENEEFTYYGKWMNDGRPFNSTLKYYQTGGGGNCGASAGNIGAGGNFSGGSSFGGGASGSW